MLSTELMFFVSLSPTVCDGPWVDVYLVSLRQQSLESGHIMDEGDIILHSIMRMIDVRGR